MSHSSKVTVADVAAAAGVSPSTVSRALRNHPDIAAATCERIQALAESMGYQPDPLISALLARRFRKGGAEIGTIAYVTAYPTRDGWRFGFLKEVYEGAREQAIKRGYSLEPFWLKEPRMTGRRLSEILVSRGIRGLLLPPLVQGYGHVRLQWERFSCAAVGYSMIRPSLHRATTHHFHNTLLALRSLRRAGYRRIGMPIAVNTNRKVGENFLAAALYFQRRYGERSVSIWMIGFDHGGQLREAVRKWIEQERPDCIFGPHSIISLECLRPGDPPFAGQGGTGFFVHHPHIDEKPRLVGAAAVDLIIGQIQRNETGIPADPKVVMVEGQWVDPTQTIASHQI